MCVQSGESGDDQVTVAWNDLLPPSSPHKLYYSLQIVEVLSHSQKLRRKSLVMPRYYLLDIHVHHLQGFSLVLQVLQIAEPIQSFRIAVELLKGRYISLIRFLLFWFIS